MISLRDLARQNQVSVSTVSRALRDDPAVREETRKRIQDAAQEYNYMPNRLVEGIFKGRTRLIALINSDLSADPTSRMISAAVDQINARGWGCVIYNTHGSEEHEAAAMHQAVGLRISGMIISSVKYEASERFYGELNKYKIPYVLSSEHAPDIAVPHIHCDDYAGGLDAIQHLYDLGHRNIANLTGPESTWAASLTHKAYFEAVARYSLPFQPGWVSATDWFSRDAKVRTLAIMKAHPEITAIFCANDLIAIGACQALAEIGLRVPEEVSIIGVGDSASCEVFNPNLTTINQNLSLIGQSCVETLFQLMELRPNTPLPRNLLDISVPAKLIVRHSTAPVRKHP